MLPRRNAGPATPTRPRLLLLRASSLPRMGARRAGPPPSGHEPAAIDSLTHERYARDVATPDTLAQAGRGPTHPGPPSPAVSAALPAPGGAPPPVRPADGRRTARPLRRGAGGLDGDGHRPWDHARLPVPRRAGRRRVPGGPRLQHQQHLHLGPAAGGQL